MIKSKRKGVVVNSRNSVRRWQVARCLSLAVAPVGLAALSAGATNLTWDPLQSHGVVPGGNGSWNLSATTNWFDGGSDVAWTDATGSSDTALFAGVPGNVALNADLGALGLSFTASGYTIAGTGNLTVGTSGIDTSTLSGTTTIGNAITLNGNQTWTGGAGTLTLNGNVNENGNALAVTGSGTTTFTGVISGGNGLLKTGTGTTILTAANTYTGTTAVQVGTLQLGGGASIVDNALPNTAVIIGVAAGTNPVTLDVRGNQQIATLAVIGNNTNATQSINIASGKTLTVGTPSAASGSGGGRGTILFGSSIANTDKSVVNFNGGGNLVMHAAGDSSPAFNGATNLNIGNSAVAGVQGSSTATSDSVVVDMSGLNSFSANMGTLKIGDSNTSQSGTNGSTLILAHNNFFFANRIDVESGPLNSTDFLKLGDGSNQIGSVNIYLGAGTIQTNGRSNGTLQFNSTNGGTLVLRGGTVDPNATALDPNAASTVTMSSGQIITSGSPTSVFDVSGHQSDLLIGTLTMASRTGAGGGANAIFSVGGTSAAAAASIVNVATLVMGSRTGVSSTAGSTVTATVNVLGGTAILGTVTMAQSLSTGATHVPATANLNVSGGNVSITSLASVANATAGNVANSFINVTGGTLTLGSDITRSGGAGTENTSLTLNGAGATLDLAGHSIGSAASPVGSGSGALNFLAGTLQNVHEINGGAGLVKNNDGTNVTTLFLAGTNTYTGDTTVNGGTLSFGNTNGAVTSVNVTGTLNVADGAKAVFAVVPGSTVSTVSHSINAINLNAAGLLDLNNSQIATQTPLATVRTFLAAGAATAFVPGTNAAIYSSVVAADSAHKSIAYLSGANTNNTALSPALTNAAAVLIRPSLIGDFNIDGKVDRFDIRAFNARNAFNDGITTHDWADGDLNFDGKVDRFDIRAFNAGNNFNSGVTFAQAQTLTSATPAAISNTTTVGTVGDGKPDLVYNSTTGDVVFKYDGYTPAAGFTVLELDIASSKNSLNANGVNAGAAGSISKGANDIDYQNLGSTPIADGADLGTIFPTGLSAAQLTTNDITANFFLNGDGSPTKFADVVAPAGVPEPATLSLIGVAAAGLLSRKRRK